MISSQPLWHFTCRHGRDLIGKRGVLLPWPHPVMRELGPVVWMTDDPAPARLDIGLTSTILRCDRMQYRYQAIPFSLPFHWVRVEPWATARDRVDPDFRAEAELHAKPETWWLAFEPIGAVLAQPKGKS